MRWGLIARGESRGLGNLTHEVWRNLRPDRTLLVEMGDLARGFPIVHDYTENVLRLPFEGGTLDEDACRWFLRGLDAVYSAETFYDWRLVEWAREEGCATVLHVMPEFLLHHGAGQPHAPTRFWNPTSWRHDHLPSGSRIVPVPVALDRFPAPAAIPTGALRVLHVAGHRAAHDRNGTSQVLMAARRIRERTVLTISGQDGRLPSTKVPGHVTIVLDPESRLNYWDVYAGHDLLVMPRRYGGLCLPVQEAMAAGLAVAMTDCPPNLDWPTLPLRAQPQGVFRTAGGDVPMFAASAPGIAEALDGLNRDRDGLDLLRGQSRAWATEHSWDALRGLWLAELASAALAGRSAA